MAKDNLYLTPGSGDTLEFGTSATVSGVLISDEVYRLTCDADCWLDFDDGAGGLTAAGAGIMMMQADSVEYVKVDENTVLHALGVTTSGLLNYIRMTE